MIDKTAIVGDQVTLDSGASIGPYCVVEGNVKLAKGVILKSHICISGNTTVGENTIIFPFASIGYSPQDLKYRGEESQLIIGKNNIIREYTTIHPGTKGGGMKTIIGDNCLLMVGSHVAHDCILGNHVIMANNATLGGHVVVGDHAIIGGLAAIHQFVRIGHNSIIGGVSAVVQDVIPFASAAGDRAKLIGINITGMKRAQYSHEEIIAVREAYKEIFFGSEDNFYARVEQVLNNTKSDTVLAIANFLKNSSIRSICLP